MTTGSNPYETPDPDDTSADLTIVETTITASMPPAGVDIGGGVTAMAETYNGAIPGPTLRFNVGDTAIVRLVNDLDHPTGIHWHGVELENCADGTEVTQDPAPVGPFVPPSPVSPTGGTHLYKFKVPRPGIYWYHPHHEHSTNRVFRGLYGMIVVTDPNEAALIADGTLPDEAQTLDLVLSDTTVCKAPGMNDAATYADPLLLPLADRPEWLNAVASQPGPTPLQLCELDPPGQAINEDGSAAVASFAAGEIPNTQKTMLTPAAFGERVNEGQTVLTNGMNVGGRLGTPAAPGALVAALTHDVQPGQGLRLRIVNCATTRYFRLRLTDAAGALVRLARIGGEGGLLDNAIYEGGNAVGPDNYDTKYEEGEILLPPASRADVVAAIPDDAAGVLTLWTRDYDRTGAGFSRIPTVPVAHFNVAGPAVMPAYTIDGGVDGVGGTPLRAAFPGQEVEELPAATAPLLDPAAAPAGDFAVAKPGMADQDIELTAGGAMTGINGVPGSFEGTPYTTIPHIASSRYAEPGEVLELTVTNPTGAHHPFHLHGFSFQPRSYTRMGGPNYNWPYQEFRDNLDVPAGYALTFRVRLDDRELADGATLGGAFGRWLFHCHIFFHAHLGMISELVTTNADGTEKPNVDVDGSWAYTASGGTATRTGTFFHPDGKDITLTASDGVFNPPVAPAASGGWAWELDSSIGPEPDGVRYVYITATDTDGRQDQAVFRLKIGAPDDGSDNGDPHIHTVDGQRYDFQAVGEFTLLRDRDGMEVQTRQWPVKTATPITDPHSGLTSCVSLNVAAAVRVGGHRIAYQPGREGGRLEFFLDGKRAQLPTGGLDLGAHRVSAIAVAGGMQLRVDYAHGPVVTITPHFWNAYNIAYLNVSIAHTQGGEGLMGRIPAQSWLPALPSGATVGPMPASLPERYVALYRTFANAWRVTGQTSLFAYAPGTSTATFTDEDWPAERPPCKLKPQFEIPGAQPPTVGIPIEEAERICKAVTDDGLHRDCVFDVATTGDPTFADAYLAAQDLKLHGCAVQIVGAGATPGDGAPRAVTVTVMPLSCDRPTPTGSVTLVVDGAERGRPKKLDKRGRAVFKVGRLTTGSHAIRAAYSGNSGENGYLPGSSPNLLCTVGRPRPGHGKGLVQVSC